MKIAHEYWKRRWKAMIKRFTDDIKYNGEVAIHNHSELKFLRPHLKLETNENTSQKPDNYTVLVRTTTLIPQALVNTATN